MKNKTWNTPGGIASAGLLDMLNQNHLLIAGMSGSGKSVLIQGLIYTALYKSPSSVSFVFVDPKRVDAAIFKSLPHTIGYASEPEEIPALLRGCIERMERRYKTMQRRGEVQSTEGKIYIVIDEFADLMTTDKKRISPLVSRLAQLGRAANIHVIIATQRSTRDIITGQIHCNIDSRVALHCPSPQDSRNIMYQKGAETLPEHGYGYYLTPRGLQLIQISWISRDEIARRVKWWTDQTHKSIFSRLARSK